MSFDDFALDAMAAGQDPDAHLGGEREAEKGARWLARRQAPVLDLIKEQFAAAGPDANLQHLLYMFEGYRARVLAGKHVHNPYADGSARALSWTVGFEMANEDY